MPFNSKYLVVKINKTSPVILFKTDKLKDSRSLLTLLGEPGDLILITNKHERYRGDGSPTYMSHVSQKGKIEYDKSAWDREYLNLCKNFNDFNQLVEAKGGDINQSEDLKNILSNKKKELNIIQE